MTTRTDRPRPLPVDELAHAATTAYAQLAHAARAAAPVFADLARTTETVFADLGRVAATATANLRALAAPPGMRQHAIMTRALDARQNRDTGPARTPTGDQPA